MRKACSCRSVAEEGGTGTEAVEAGPFEALLEPTPFIIIRMVTAIIPVASKVRTNKITGLTGPPVSPLAGLLVTVLFFLVTVLFFHGSYRAPG